MSEKEDGLGVVAHHQGNDIQLSHGHVCNNSSILFIYFFFIIIRNFCRDAVAAGNVGRRSSLFLNRLIGADAWWGVHY